MGVGVAIVNGAGAGIAHAEDTDAGSSASSESRASERNAAPRDPGSGEAGDGPTQSPTGSLVGDRMEGGENDDNDDKDLVDRDLADDDLADDEDLVDRDLADDGLADDDDPTGQDDDASFLTARGNSDSNGNQPTLGTNSSGEAARLNESEPRLDGAEVVSGLPIETATVEFTSVPMAVAPQPDTPAPSPTAVLTYLPAPIKTPTLPGPQAPMTPPMVGEFLVAGYRDSEQVRTRALAATTATAATVTAAAGPGVVGEIPLGDGIPYSVVTSPDGTRAYVVTFSMGSGGAMSTGTVIGFDTVTNQPVGAPIGIGVYPLTAFSASAKPVAFNRDGSRLYVTSWAQGDDGGLGGIVTVIDTVSGQVVGDPISLGNAMPTGIVISPDGRRLYAANADSTVMAVNLQSSVPEIETIPIGVFTGPGAGMGNVDIVIAQNDAQTVYISDYAERAVYVLNPATNEVDPEPVLIEGMPLALAISPDGRRVFVNTMSFPESSSGPVSAASLVVIDAATKNIVDQGIDYGSTVQGMATNGMTLVSPDGQYVYTLGNSQLSGAPVVGMWQIDVTTGTARMLSNGDATTSAVLSPDGTRLYTVVASATDGVQKVAVVALDTATGATITLFPVDSGAAIAMSLTPDGSRLYLGQASGIEGGDVSTLIGRVVIIDTGTSNVVDPPAPVNPILAFVRNAVRTITTSVQAVVHAIGQNVASLARLVGTIATIAGSTVFETGLQLVQAANALYRIGGEALGHILTGVEIAAAAISGQAGKIPFIITGAIGDVISAVRNHNPAGFLFGQAVSIWSYVFQEIQDIDWRALPQTVQYALQNPGVALQELAGATLTVGARVATSVGGAVGGVVRETVDLARNIGNVARAAGGQVVSTVARAAGSASQAVLSTARTTVNAAGQAMNTIVRTGANIVNNVGRGARDFVNTVASWRPWPFG